MKYFIPAWHTQYKDWSMTAPTIENYDSSDYMRVLKNSGEEIGLIITDYQPQLLSKLNQILSTFDEIFSVFDYLQGVHGFEDKVIELYDFNWPLKAIIDYTPFKTLVILENRLYATVVYDTDGHILKIDYAQNDQELAYTLHMDSRGFISSKENANEITYFDPYGNWRLKEEKFSGKVTVNSIFKFCKFDNYDNINVLISEILLDYLNHRLGKKDHLIATLDNDAAFDQAILESFAPIYLINDHQEFDKSIKSISKDDLVVSSESKKEKLLQNYQGNFNISVIPTFSARFNLGHSQRQSVQEIGFFAEKSNRGETEAVIQNLCEYLVKDPEHLKLKILAYSPTKEAEINQIIDAIKEENKDRFVIGKDDKANNAENAMLDNLDQEDKTIYLDVEVTRLTNITDVLTNLDTVRVLINWGEADELMQISGISIGIPQIQNFDTSTVVDGKNGRIVSDLNEMNDAINDYLNNLNSWNNTLVYNVKTMNQYSEDNIVEKWNELFNRKEE